MATTSASPIRSSSIPTTPSCRCCPARPSRPAIFPSSAVPARLEKTGAGALLLSGNNSYSGGTLLSAGTLGLGSDLAAGTGTITARGSAIDYGAGVAIANPIIIDSDELALRVARRVGTPARRDFRDQRPAPARQDRQRHAVPVRHKRLHGPDQCPGRRTGRQRTVGTGLGLGFHGRFRGAAARRGRPRLNPADRFAGRRRRPDHRRRHVARHWRQRHRHDVLGCDLRPWRHRQERRRRTVPDRQQHLFRPHCGQCRPAVGRRLDRQFRGDGGRRRHARRQRHRRHHPGRQRRRHRSRQFGRHAHRQEQPDLRQRLALPGRSRHHRGPHQCGGRHRARQCRAVGRRRRGGLPAQRQSAEALHHSQCRGRPRRHQVHRRHRRRPLDPDQPLLRRRQRLSRQPPGAQPASRPHHQPAERRRHHHPVFRRQRHAAAALRDARCTGPDAGLRRACHRRDAVRLRGLRPLPRRDLRPLRLCRWRCRRFRRCCGRRL